MSAVGSASAAPTLKPQTAAQPTPREIEAAKRAEDNAEVQNPKAAPPKPGQEPLATTGSIGTLVNERV